VHRAARGAGGGQFGIHTSFVFRTAPAVDLIVFDRTYRTQIEQVLTKLLELAHDAPRELGLKLNLRATRDGSGGGDLVVNILGQWAGPKDALVAWLAPLDAIATPDPALGYLREVAYWDGQALLSDEGKPELSYERSRYALARLGVDAVTAIVGHLREWPGTSGSLTWKGFLTGGAVVDVSPEATAFVHRRDWLLTTIDLNWTPSEDSDRVFSSLEWLDRFHDAMAPFTSRESYQNFIDAGQTDWPRAYHGTNLERLVGIKKQYDPTNVFTFAQGIPTRMPAGEAG
jgi:FAD/FMN-containing dehydrogenase